MRIYPESWDCSLLLARIVRSVTTLSIDRGVVIRLRDIISLLYVRPWVMCAALLVGGFIRRRWKSTYSVVLRKSPG